MPNDQQGDMNPDGGFDIADVLGATPQGDTSGTEGDVSQSAQGQQSAQTVPFKFAGKEWPNPAEAEKHFNKVYGKFSEVQGLNKKLVAAMQRDPELLKALSGDPEWSEILGKLGIDNASKQLDQRRQDEAAQGPQNMEQYREQWDVERAQFRLEREQEKFEKRLGRDLSQAEHNAILDIIGNSPSLSYEQAYKLAFHDKLLKEAATKAQSQRTSVNRPKPPPSFAAGVKLDLKKPIHAMTKEEAREAMRQDVREGLARS